MNPNELGSAPAGSPEEEILDGGSVDTGRPSIDPEQYQNLEKAFGKQGQELGEYRQFFADVSPLLEKLDKNPDLVQAIINDKIDLSLINATADGDVSTKVAKAVTKANEDIKKEIGKKAYNEASPEDISKLIEEKVSAAKNELLNSLKESEDTRSFEARVNSFISNTPDFADYAADIDKWLDTHDVTDIEVAYYAVKGQLSEKAAKQKALEEQGEYAKDIALNAGGGNSRVMHSGEDASRVLDSLIAGKSNPNIF